MSAYAITFSVSMVLQAEDLWDILRSGQFPHINRAVRVEHGFVKLRILLKRVAEDRKCAAPQLWTKSEMRRYKQFLLSRRKIRARMAETPAAHALQKEFVEDFAQKIYDMKEEVDAVRGLKGLVRTVLVRLSDLSAALIPRAGPSVVTSSTTPQRDLGDAIRELRAEVSGLRSELRVTKAELLAAQGSAQVGSRR